MKTKKLLLIVLVLFAGFSLAQEQAIYVSDAANFSTGPYKILKYDPDGSNPVSFIEDNLAWPQDILFLEDQGVVLISNLNSGAITRHNASNGSYIDNFATGIGGPTRMKIGADELIYVLQWNGNGKVLRYEQDGTFVDEFTDSGVDQSIGIDWDSAGNLYISSYTGDLVRRYDTNGAEIGDFITSNLEGPTNIHFEDDGNLLVFDYLDASIKRFNSSGGYLGEFISGLQFPEGLAFHPTTGDIYLGNGGTASVKRYTAGGSFIEDIVSSGSGGLITPNAVVLRENVLSVSEYDPGTPFLFNTFGREIVVLRDAFNHFETIEIYNLMGQQVHRFTADGLVWNADGATQGVYLVIAESQSSREVQRVVIR